MSSINPGPAVAEGSTDQFVGSEVKVAEATGKVGFYGKTPIAKQTGVAVSAEGVHAALVALGLIAA